MTDQKLTFYGDDFTGSTDAMDALYRSGVRSVLFLEPPDPMELSEFPDVEAVGIAGASRSMTPEEMDESLPSVFKALSEIDSPIFHYKICSTFDSAPDVGSIGHAIDLAVPIFRSPNVPLSVGVPQLDRYVAFGNLFAAASDNCIYRIDRHPTMRDHPITPMTESDLGRHLGKQTDRSSSLVDVRDLEANTTPVDDTVDETVNAQGDIVIFDTMTEDHLETVGQLIWDQSQDLDDDQTLFVVGSSGVEYALADHLLEPGENGSHGGREELSGRDQIAVLSGSASPVTAAQINYAEDHGFLSIQIDTADLLDPDRAEGVMEEVISRAQDALKGGSCPLLYTARGRDDPSITKTRDQADTLDISNEAMSRHLGHRLGEILRRLVIEADLDRVCVAGGDTCSYVVPELGINALTVSAPVSPGAPLCRAHAEEIHIDDLEIALKGGQLGEEEYFLTVRDGQPVN